MKKFNLDYLPDNPQSVYKEWKGWRDFYGTIFLPFKEAREFARSLNVKTQLEWKNYCRSGQKPNNIPYNPNDTYRDKGWIGYGDWLGTGNTLKKDFLSYGEVKKFVKKLKLKNCKEWRAYWKLNERPNNIPYGPDETYKNTGWTNWGDFLGTNWVDTKKREYMSFNESKQFASQLNLDTQEDWYEYWRLNKKPSNIPSNPFWVYRNLGWTTWADFLGKDEHFIRLKNALSFEEAKSLIRKLNLQSVKEWYRHWELNERPNNIPSHPDMFYKDKGWISWGGFLGTGRIHTRHRIFLSFKSARCFVRKLKLKNCKEWFEYWKSNEKPDNIPYAPGSYYKDKGWISWPDFLGKKK